MIPIIAPIMAHITTPALNSEPNPRGHDLVYSQLDDQLRDLIVVLQAFWCVCVRFFFVFLKGGRGGGGFGFKRLGLSGVGTFSSRFQCLREFHSGPRG